MINALILCGAVPVYVNPTTHPEIGISLGVPVDKMQKAIEENPDAVAVLINNPTYYGICSDLKSLTDLAHSHGMKVLCDEAHGTHLYFGSNLPISGMAAGADLAAVSMHKSGGSLTQSSVLLTGQNMDKGLVRQIINLTQTTSASYLLLSSLDLSRRNLALRGKNVLTKLLRWQNMREKKLTESVDIMHTGVNLWMVLMFLIMTLPSFAYIQGISGLRE